MQIEAYKKKILNKKCLYETQKTAILGKISYRPNTFTTKLRGRSFDSAGEGEGGQAVCVESEYIFPTEAYCCHMKKTIVFYVVRTRY